MKELYKKSGLTYDELARLTGIKRNTLACYLTGKRQPSDIVTERITEKVTAYLKCGGEYINKAYRDDFAEKVYSILAGNSPNKEREIMKAFDELPTVSICIPVKHK